MDMMSYDSIWTIFQSLLSGLSIWDIRAGLSLSVVNSTFSSVYRDFVAKSKPCVMIKLNVLKSYARKNIFDPNQIVEIPGGVTWPSDFFLVFKFVANETGKATRRRWSPVVHVVCGSCITFKLDSTALFRSAFANAALGSSANFSSLSSDGSVSVTLVDNKCIRLVVNCHLNRTRPDTGRTVDGMELGGPTLRAFLANPPLAPAAPPLVAKKSVTRPRRMAASWASVLISTTAKRERLTNTNGELRKKDKKKKKKRRKGSAAGAAGAARAASSQDARCDAQYAGRSSWRSSSSREAKKAKARLALRKRTANLVGFVVSDDESD